MDIIGLANQVGFPIQHEEWRKATEEFANLVAAQEREECAKLCMAVPRTGSKFARLIRARGTT